MFQPGTIWPDHNGVHINAHGGGVIYHKDRYYWFGEHKIAGEAGNQAYVGVHVYSSKDLYYWKDEGIAFSVSEDPDSPVVKGCIIERPKVIYHAENDEFIMWFHHELRGRYYGSALTGLAVSKTITGPYCYVHSLRPNAGEWPLNVKPVHRRGVPETTKDSYCGGPGCLSGPIDTVNILGRDFKKGQMSRDMTLFVDDDGTAYHIHSSEENSTIHISRLSDDYKSFSSEYARAFPGRYMEAPALFKHKGVYYLVASGCTGWSHNAARSAVADTIFGPWKELGNPCISTGKDTTYDSQGTYILPVRNRENAFIFMADRWKPENAIDGRYVWLPVQFAEDGKVFLAWTDEWDLEYWSRGS